MDKKKLFEIHFRLQEQQQGYLDACARIRKITTRALVRELLERICQDNLVLAILGDDEQWHNFNKKLRESKAPIINMELCSDSSLPTHSHLTCPRCISSGRKTL